MEAATAPAAMEQPGVGPFPEPGFYLYLFETENSYYRHRMNAFFEIPLA
jgi:hypothetical protein